MSTIATKSPTTTAFWYCNNGCGERGELKVPYLLPIEHVGRVEEQLCPACTGGRFFEPRSAYDFNEGTPVPGQGLALGSLHPSCPSRSVKREKKAAVFLSPDDSSVVVKVIPLLHCPSVENEVRLQRMAAEMGVAPCVHGVTYTKAFAFMTMERVNGETMADLYGEAEENTPPELAAQVRAILRTLAVAGLEFPDAQPYNFLVDEDSGRVVVIDFEHAVMRDAGNSALGEQGAEGSALWNYEGWV